MRAYIVAQDPFSRKIYRKIWNQHQSGGGIVLAIMECFNVPPLDELIPAIQSPVAAFD
jgi:hypothetical protein